MGKHILPSLIRNREKARKFLSIFTALSLVFQNGAVFLSPAFAATSLPSSVQLEQWETKAPGKWITGNLGSHNSSYTEGETIPFRLDVGGLATSGNPYTFSICRDYDNGPKRGYLFLTPYDVDYSPDPGGPVTSTNGPFDGVNVNIASYIEVGGQGACKAGERETQVTLNSTGNAAAYILWGGHLASPIDPGVGAGNGAGSFPGSSLHMSLLQPSKDRSINPGAIIRLATITVQKVVDSGDADPDQWGFNISPNPNSEPLPKYPATGTDTITFLGLSTGDYQITETSVSGYAFVSGGGINCSFDGGDGSTATASVTAATDPIDATCIFHNALSNGDLTVRKDLDTDNDGQVDQTNVGTWSWDLDGGNQNFPTGSTQSVLIGAHTISEDLQNGWHVVDLTCGGQSLGAITNSEVNVPVQGLECTFTNARDTGTITVLKDIDWDESGEIGDHPNDVSGATNWTWDIESGEQNIPTGESRTLPTGSYTVTEDVKNNFHLVSWSCTDQTSGGTNEIPVALVSNDQQITCTFVNAPDTGSISGYKYEDADGDPNTTGDQSGFGGWEIKLYRCLSDFSQCDELVDQVLTDINGFFNFDNLVPGFYRVVEEIRAGWTNLTSIFINIVLDPGEEAQNNDFVNFECVTIWGYKWLDKNIHSDGTGRGVKDPEDTLEDGWEIELHEGSVLGNVIATATTGDGDWPGGYYEFEVCQPGDYIIDEVNQTGYTQLHPGGQGQDASYQVEVTSGTITPTGSHAPEDDDLGFDFANFKNIKISGYKFNDLDGDGIWDPGEPGIGGWLIQMWGSTNPSRNTNPSGYFQFTNMGPGIYYIGEPNMPAGWTQTIPSDPANYNPSDGYYYKFEWPAVDQEDVNFGNFQNTSVTACKLTDADGDLQTTGDQTPYQGWTVYLSIDGVRQLPGQSTGENGCYTWTDLGPGHSYDVEEDMPSGWTALTPTSHDFGPAQSGNVTYTYTFINTELGTIIVEKQTDPDGASDDFTFTGDIAGTISDGQQLTVSDLLPGTYTSTENDPTPEYDLTNIVCDDTDSLGDLPTRKATFNLQPGETVTCVFTNTKRGSISGHKWNDLDGDGYWDGGEPALDGWTIFLDENGNKALDAGEVSTSTSGGGVYSFSNLVPGDYDVCEVLQPGWTRTLPGLGCYYLTVLPGQNLTDYDFGNFENVSIKVCKYKDTEPYGQLSAQDQPMSGWLMTLKKDGQVFDSQSTGGNGCYTWNDLGPGSYSVEEEVKPGWTDTNGTTHDFGQVTSGHELYTHYFLNRGALKICGTKYDDLDGDGILDPGEPGIEGWEITITGNTPNQNTNTDENGHYCFENLEPGGYTITEENRSGWTHTSPSSVPVTLTNHDEAVDFFNFKPGRITVCKYDDLNGNGILDQGEPGIARVTIAIQKTCGGGCLVTQAIKHTFKTEEGGCLTFEELNYGTYLITELVPEGYYPTFPLDPNSHQVLVESGTDVTVFFLNARYGSIGDFIWVDADGDKVQDPAEPGISGVTVKLYLDGTLFATQATNSNGGYLFTNLKAGNYTVDVVDSTVPAKYVLTTANDPMLVSLDPGENELGADFGYKKKEGEVLAATGLSPLNLLLALMALTIGIFLRRYSIRLRRRRVS